MIIDRELPLFKMLKQLGIQSLLLSVVTLKVMELYKATVIQFIHPGNFVAEQF